MKCIRGVWLRGGQVKANLSLHRPCVLQVCTSSFVVFISTVGKTDSLEASTWQCLGVTSLYNCVGCMFPCFFHIGHNNWKLVNFNKKAYFAFFQKDLAFNVIMTKVPFKVSNAHIFAEKKCAFYFFPLESCKAFHPRLVQCLATANSSSNSQNWRKCWWTMSALITVAEGDEPLYGFWGWGLSSKDGVGL